MKNLQQMWLLYWKSGLKQSEFPMAKLNGQIEYNPDVFEVIYQISQGCYLLLYIVSYTLLKHKLRT